MIDLTAQDKTDAPSKNILKTSLSPILIGPVPFTSEFRLVYEREIIKHHALQLGISYLSYNGNAFIYITVDSAGNDYDFTDLNANGFRGQIAYKYYFGSIPLKGFYISPQFSYSSVRFENSEDPLDHAEAKYVYGAIALGWQLIVEDIFTLDVFTGFGQQSKQWKQTDPDDSIFRVNHLNRNVPRLILGANIGLAF